LTALLETVVGLPGVELKAHGRIAPAV
jgi:hypothetical protein